MESKKNTKIIDALLSGSAEEKFQGKQVVVIGQQVFILPEDDQEAARFVEKLETQYPGEIPHLVFVPRSETYILIPVGFLDTNNVPPLLGRHQCMELFKTCFENHELYFG